MTTLSSTEYFNIRKELREKYFTDNNFTQLTDVKEFQQVINSTYAEHIGDLSEYYFIIKYLVKPDQQQILNEKAQYDDIKKLKLILSNPNQYLNPKSNIQAVYDYLQEIKQYNTDEWLVVRAINSLMIFDEYKSGLSISAKIENNQQLWL